MDCHESRLLIDECVHGTLAGDLAARLDEHLNACGECREDLRQLKKVRTMLGAAREDHAPEEALRAGWSAIQRMNSGPAMSVGRKTAKPITTARWKKIAAASLLAAALFMMAFSIGTMRRMGSNETAAAGAAKGFAEAEEIYHRTDYGETGLSKKSDKLSLVDSTGKGDQPASSSVAAPDDGRRADKSNAYAVEDLSRELKSFPAPENAPPLDGYLSRGGKPSSDSKAHDVQNGKAIFNYFEALHGGNGSDTQPKKADPNKPDSTEPNAAPSALKIIKTGELTIEVKNFVETARAADALVIKFQAQIADSRTTDLPGAAKRGDIVIRVAPERFEELFAELKKLGTVLQDRAGAADITAQYVDTEARIKNMRVEEERLQDLIKSKTYLDKIQSLLEVERELTRVRGEIESMQGQMRVWQEQIALSTIRLTLQEPSRAVPSGSLSVEVGALSDAKKALDAALTNSGAQLLNGQTTKRADGTLMGTYTLRVKFGRFADLTAAIKGLGRVQDEKILNQPFAAGVPDGAQDVPCDIQLVLYERSIQLPTANIQLEVTALTEALPKLDLALANAQASIVSNQTQRQGNGVSTAQISIRVRAGNFAALVDALPALGRITHRTLGGESGKIQGGAADVPCTVELYLFEQPKELPGGAMTLEVGGFTDARDRLTALVKENGIYVSSSTSQQRSDSTWSGSFTLSIKAEKMDAVIGQLEKLGRVKSREIKGLGLGELSRIDPNVNAEVAVTIQEAPTMAPQEEGSFRLMLRDTFGGFLTSMGYVIRGLALMLPWLALIAAVFALIWRYTRPKAAAAARETKEPPRAP